MEIRSKEPKLTQKHFSKQLGYSDSTIKRYTGDIHMASPYNGNNNKNENKKQILQQPKRIQ